MQASEIPEQWKKGPSGGTADCYFNAKDPTSILKLYHKKVPKATVEAEFRTSRVAENIKGLRTPRAKELTSFDGKTGILFERIADGKTLADLCHEHPEQADGFASLFAQQAKLFAELPCDAEGIPSVTDQMNEAIEAVFSAPAFRNVFRRRLSELEREGGKTVLLHGDMHPGNIMLHEDTWYWIDLGYLSKGPEILSYMSMDMMMNFSLTFLFTANRFGLNQKGVRTFFRKFMEECTGIHDEEALKKYFREIRRFTPLYVIYIIYAENWTGIAKFFMKELCVLYARLTNRAGGNNL